MFFVSSLSSAFFDSNKRYTYIATNVYVCNYAVDDWPAPWSEVADPNYKTHSTLMRNGLVVMMVYS